MAQKVKIMGIVEKVVRSNGKQHATMLITIPAKGAVEVPLGAVTIELEVSQMEMFPKKEPVRGAQDR